PLLEQTHNTSRNRISPSFSHLPPIKHTRRPHTQPDTSFAPTPLPTRSNLTCTREIQAFARLSTQTNASANEVSPCITKRYFVRTNFDSKVQKLLDYCIKRGF